MKKNYLFILSLLLTCSIFAQSGKEVNLNAEDNEIHSRFNIRKEKGFYNIMQVSLLIGNCQIADRTVYYVFQDADFSSPSTNNIRNDQPYTRSTLAVSPSITITNGYMFNEHWAAGAGVGIEIFNHNLFPLFAELRYTLWDHKISPFVVVKGGYSLGGLKARYYDELNLNWTPYYIEDATFRHFGGLMFHPEIGVKLPLTRSDDLLFTAAYRYQKTKSIARKDYDKGQFDEWEHNEKISRLSFGVAIMFR